MDKRSKAAGGTLIKKIAVSQVTVDRIVGGQYEWKDKSYAVRKRRRAEAEDTTGDGG